MVSGEFGWGDPSGGPGSVPTPRSDEAPQAPGPGVAPVDPEGETVPETPASVAFFNGVEEMIWAWWHDPRTALKYVVGVLRHLQANPDQYVDPTEIPPITERQKEDV